MKALQQALEALRQAAQKLTCIDTLNDCEAAIAALEVELAQVVEPVNAWQPIETAPKTSKTILVYCAEMKNTYTVTWWRDEEFPWSGKWKHSAGNFLNEVPTHWMPRPTPPGATP